MPSKSEKQHKLMQAACHDPDFAKKVDVPQDVACDYFEADQRKDKKHNHSEKNKSSQ